MRVTLRVKRTIALSLSEAEQWVGYDLGRRPMRVTSVTQSSNADNIIAVRGHLMKKDGTPSTQRLTEFTMLSRLPEHIRTALLAAWEEAGDPGGFSHDMEVEVS
jgi:hypothetical protein